MAQHIKVPKRRKGMEAVLYECALLNPEDGHAQMLHLWTWAKRLLERGTQLRLTARTLEDLLTDQQRAYYHGVVLTTIAQGAEVGGRRYAMEVWKEWYREKFLGYKTVTVTNPYTGQKSRRRQRVSTEDLGSKGYARLIDAVIADAATEHGLDIPPPTPQNLDIDPQTGEIYNHP